MANEKRLIDANGIVAVAERAYDAWNLAMNNRARCPKWRPKPRESKDRKCEKHA